MTCHLPDRHHNQTLACIARAYHLYSTRSPPRHACHMSHACNDRSAVGNGHDSHDLAEQNKIHHSRQPLHGTDDCQLQSTQSNCAGSSAGICTVCTCRSTPVGLHRTVPTALVFVASPIKLALHTQHAHITPTFHMPIKVMHARHAMSCHPSHTLLAIA
jgi:hypothetical protein